MNGNLLTFFLFMMVSFPALCQDPEPVPFPADTTTPSQDVFRLAPGADSAVSATGMPDRDTVAAGRRGRERAGRAYDPGHSPYKAIMYALVLPGLGQAYNHRYYKIPIVYAALGGAGYAINFNTKKYRESSYEYALAPNETNEWYLRIWRRNLELSYIGLVLGYALQVIDAYVDANLYNWDVNSNLSLRIAPSVQPLVSPAGMMNQSCGITCTLNFGRN